MRNGYFEMAAAKSARRGGAVGRAAAVAAAATHAFLHGVLTPAERAMLDETVFPETEVRVYRASSRHDNYFWSPSLGGWKTEMAEHWVEFPLLAPPAIGSLDYFLLHLQDFYDYHLHIVLPRQYRVDTANEPVRGWEWALERKYSEGPPPPPRDDVHVITVSSRPASHFGGHFGGRVDERPFWLVGEASPLSLAEIKQYLVQAIVERALPTVRRMLRRAHVASVLTEVTDLPTDLIAADVVPFIDYYRHRRHSRRRRSHTPH